MITEDYLRTETKLSQRNRRTSDFLRNFAIFTVGSPLRQHYTNDFSIRCLQSSCGFRSFLRFIGLKSTL